MLTQVEAKELVLRSTFERRRPTEAFVADRIAARARRHKEQRRLAPDDWIGFWHEYLAIAGGASSFNVTLDTTAPTAATLSLNGGAPYAGAAVISAVLHTGDASTTGYQIKIWGSVDAGANPNIQATEGASAWISPTWTTGNATQSVTLSTGDGSKTINAKIRDDVWNETTTLTQSITLDTTVPVITIQTGPDVPKISKISGKRVVSVTWQSDSALQAYEVAVVANSGAVRGSGTVLLTTNGSTNVSGGTTAATTNVTTTIDGRDLEVASSGDGVKVVKIFGQDDSGSWSLA